MRIDKSMFRLLLFLPFVFLVVSTELAQGESIDEILKSVDPGDREPSDESLLDEGSGSDFDPLDELDSVTTFRLEKKIAETKRIGKEAERTRKNDASRMREQCQCVLEPILCAAPLPTIFLEARRIDDTRSEAERDAERDRAKRRARAKARARARAENEKSTICWNWYCTGGAGSEQFGSSIEDRCPGGKRRKGSGEGDLHLRQLQTLQAELEKERAIEERLARQRRLEERRRHEARVAKRERERDLRIATDKAMKDQRREQSHQRAAAALAEREARELDRCQAQWDQGRNPCGCGHLAAAPAWVQASSTCEK